MFSRITKPLIGTLSCPVKLGLSLARSTVKNHRLRIGLLYRCELLSVRGICTGVMMENSQQSKAGAAVVAVCQMNSTSDVYRNLGICENLVREAKSRGAKVRLTSVRVPRLRFSLSEGSSTRQLA